MVLLWMLYASAVAGLAGLAALAVEGALRVGGRPTRWVWVAATVASLALPAWTWISAGTAGPARPATSLGVLEVLGPGAVGGAPSAGFPRWPDLSRWDTPAAVGWGAASGLLALLFAVSAGRLLVARREWTFRTVEGVPLRVAPDVGPAAVGIWRPTVVIPRWVLGESPDTRRWIVAHELEHVRARDPALVAAGLLIAVLLPWNVALWWQLRRLRLSVETDCDRRVLERMGGAGRRRYGALLIEVGRRSGRRLPVPAFAESRTSLEHRIRIMTRSRPSAPLLRAVLLVAFGAVLLVAACVMPGPDRDSPVGPEIGSGTTAEVDDARVDAGTTRAVFTPYTKAPVLLNESEVARALDRGYPPLLRDAGVGGTVSVMAFVDTTGSVTGTRIDGSSGHDALDRAALDVVGVMEFEPALNRDRAVAVWIEMPVTFRTAASGTSETEEAAAERPEAESRPAPDAARGAPSARAEALAGEPVFTPYTVAPKLVNEPDVVRTLEAAYPPLLRDAGIGGRTLVYFLIDRDGSVVDVRMNRTSGHDALDEAALEVARAMEFTPAMNRDEAVPVWISLPISFGVR